MSARVGIIGAGWYGCHLGSTLMALGFEVKIFEKNENILGEASGNNQFRLHLGFHYARHHRTRIQSRDGFLRFTERYPAFSAPVAENIYAVASRNSLMDYATYRIIMTSAGVDVVEIPNASVPLEAVSGLLLTEERVLRTERARTYFRERLDGRMDLGHRVTSVDMGLSAARINGERFDYVIDASWGHFSKPPVDCKYEPTLLLYYRQKAGAVFPAITLVDGPLCSLYPTEAPGIYTLSSVPYTPLGDAVTAAAAVDIRDGLTSATVNQRRRQMEEQIREYIPYFDDVFEFVDIQRSIKTKVIGASDDRSCSVFKQDRMISVMSGKIDTIFTAAERILSFIEQDVDIESGIGNY